MTEAKGTREKSTVETAEPETETTAQNASESESTAAKKSEMLPIGLEDYCRWKSMFKDHKPDKNEKPFRRGRIWC